MGARTALVTFDPGTIGAMSCNPAIGGLGKGHLVREVDAFDGLIGRAADAAAIHYRMLNRSKGSAVWGPRVQADRALFKAAVQTMLAAQSDLEVIAGEAAELRDSGWTSGGPEAGGGQRRSRRPPSSCAPAHSWADGCFAVRSVSRAGVSVKARPRLLPSACAKRSCRWRGSRPARRRASTDARSIGPTSNEQASDAEPWTMSPLTSERRNPQVFCAITRTNPRSHEIIRANLHRSPLFTGAIGAAGPRYCPSIEDKIHRFADRDGHQVFLEPEGLDDSTWSIPTASAHRCRPMSSSRCCGPWRGSSGWKWPCRVTRSNTTISIRAA